MYTTECKVTRILDTILTVNPIVEKAFYCASPNKTLQIVTKHLMGDQGWSEVDTTRKFAADFWLLAASDLVSNTETPIAFDSIEDQPKIVLIYCERNEDKKHAFMSFEALGYRAFTEYESFIYFQLIEDSVEVLEALPAGDAKIRKSLTARRWADNEFILSTAADIIQSPADTMLRSERFDIAIKAHFARLYKMQCAKPWREYAYYEHLLRITGKGKSIKENDGTGKEGFETFLDVFESLIDEKDTSNIPLFPSNIDGIALDGAHRIAAAIEKKQDVKSFRFRGKFPMSCDYSFFRGWSHGHTPCHESITDEAAIEYTRIKNSAAIALLFPCANDHQKGIEEIANNAEIVYQREFVFFPSAGGALLRQIYLGQPWLDWSGKDSGFEHKKKRCFPFAGKMTAILFDNYDPRKLRSIKEKIRSIYQLDNHSIHITDSKEETLNAAQLLFNKNSLDVLNAGTGNLTGFHEKFFKLKEWMLFHKIDAERLCVDSSAVLSVLGLRECRDLDFLYHGNIETVPPAPEGIECHNEIANLYEYPIDEIIGDPRLHFWYMGVKFCAPHVVIGMKKRRGESKDDTDIRLLASKMSSQRQTALQKFIGNIILYGGLFLSRISARRRQIKRSLKKRISNR